MLALDRRDLNWSGQMYLDDLVTEYGTEGRKRKEGEFELQKDVCVFLRWALPKSAFFFAVPNGSLRQQAIARKLAATGTRAGVPDLVVVFQSRAYFIELKVPGGVLSAAQKQVIPRLRDDCGAQVAICHTVPEVEAVLRGWQIPLQAKLNA